MKDKKGFIWVLVLLIVVLGSAAVLYNTYGDMPMPDNVAQQGGEEQQEQELSLAPDFTVLDWDGNEVHLSDFRGKPVVLNFWASWCGPCKMEMPDFQSKCDELAGEVVFVMVNATDGGRETVDTAKAFISESGYTFPVYFDTSYEAIYAYGVNAFPTTLFIDAEGYLVAYGQGAMSADTLQMGIDYIYK